MSIKDNILFGSPLNEERYNDVIKACCLLVSSAFFLELKPAY